ncbi:hypothetical protein YC2023_018939 [Brassica napus]
MRFRGCVANRVELAGCPHKTRGLFNDFDSVSFIVRFVIIPHEGKPLVLDVVRSAEQQLVNDPLDSETKFWSLDITYEGSHAVHKSLRRRTIPYAEVLNIEAILADDVKTTLPISLHILDDLNSNRTFGTLLS